MKQGLVEGKEKGGEDKADAEEMLGEAERKQDPVPLLFAEEKMDKGFEEKLRASFFKLLFSLKATESVKAGGHAGEDVCANEEDEGKKRVFSDQGGVQVFDNLNKLNPLFRLIK